MCGGLRGSRYNGMIITFPLALRTSCVSSLFVMPISTLSRCVLIAAASAVVAACSTFDKASGGLAGIVTPYKVEVVQGNFVSKEQKEALQAGMPRNQVRDVLGSPLVTSAFHADRWEYVFTIRRQGQEPQQRKLTVFFKGDELAKVESDELISEQDFVSSLSTNRALGKVPVLEAAVDKLPAPNTTKTPSTVPQNASGAAEATRVYPPLEPAIRQ
jgi:outer membrane protein assembly factor BamE